MSISTVDLGTSPTGSGGDTNRGAFTKVNANFTELAPGVVSKSADFTLEAAHANKTIRVTGTTTVTIPPDLDAGFGVTIVNVGTALVTFAKGAGVSTTPTTLPDLDNTGDADITVAFLQHAGANAWDVFSATAEPVTLGFAVSDETTALTTGAAKLRFRMPFPMTVDSVRFTVNTAPTGSGLQFDINEEGVSVLSTKATIDAAGKSTVTAAAQPVLSDTSWADNAEMTVDIDAVGSTIAGAGAKLWVYGYRL